VFLEWPAIATFVVDGGPSVAWADTVQSCGGYHWFEWCQDVEATALFTAPLLWPCCTYQLFVGSSLFIRYSIPLSFRCAVVVFCCDLVCCCFSTMLLYLPYGELLMDTTMENLFIVLKFRWFYHWASVLMLFVDCCGYTIGGDSDDHWGSVQYSLFILLFWWMTISLVMPVSIINCCLF